jgi:hypothetical protein
MNIGYIVEETNRAGAIRSRLFTICAWHALAEWMVKVHRPIGFPPGSRAGDGDLTLEVNGESVIVDCGFLSLVAEFRRDNETVRKIQISTQIMSRVFESHYSVGTSRIYLQEEYDRAIAKMQGRLSTYCENQMDVGYVLAQFAANDPLHGFWKPRLLNRGRALSF